jgi:hypothetical protein
MINFIKRIINVLKLRIIETNSFPLISNYYRKNFEEKVLLSYIKEPFKSNPKITHTNYYECKIAAEIFNELGFIVDVISHDNNEFSDFDDYRIIYGMGSPLENSLKKCITKSRKVIFYSTGFNPAVSNQLCVERLKDIYLSKNKMFYDSCRIVEESRSLTPVFSDAIIALGDSNVAKSYLSFNLNTNNIFSLNAFPLDIHKIEIEKKDFSIARDNFLWFGSAGKIHKGLDLLFDLFLVRKDINLHVCCSLDGEDNFWNHYLPLIKNSNNIILHGFVDVNSKLFESILYNCGSLIFPSVSEGGSPSIITICCNSGIIPIVSKNCGIELSKNSLVLDEISISSINSRINEIKNLSNDELKIKSHQNMLFFSSLYSIEKYRKELKDIILKILANDL